MANKRGRPLVERFWEKVDTSAAQDGCWNWKGAQMASGYGLIGIDGRPHTAHRAAWEMAYGEVEPGQVICHVCDNPRCVRPTHLFAGSHADNVTDKVKKGRGAKGFSLPHTKLSDEEVRMIRNSQASAKELASFLGVSTGYVNELRKGKKRKGV